MSSLDFFGVLGACHLKGEEVGERTQSISRSNATMARDRGTRKRGREATIRARLDLLRCTGRPRENHPRTAHVTTCLCDQSMKKLWEVVGQKSSLILDSNILLTSSQPLQSRKRWQQSTLLFLASSHTTLSLQLQLQETMIKNIS